MEYAEKNGVRDSVSYYGHVDTGELKFLYSNALALVFPSLLGPNNFPPLEAMYNGCPVIVSNLEGHKEQLGSSALYFDPFDPHDLYSKIDYLLSNPKFCSDLIMSGKIHVEKLTVGNYLDQLLDVAKEYRKYRNLWGEGSTPLIGW